MPIATLTNIAKSFGHKTLFEKLNLNVYRGQRIGLVGANGCGKTTLLRILLGDVTPDDGAASIGRGVRVGYLEQHPTFDHDSTVMDESEQAFADLHVLSHRLRDLEHEMAHFKGEELERILGRYELAQHEFEAAGGYAWRHRLEATLLGVGLAPDTWQQQVSTLSGGQRSRLALAKLLIGEPDILLLDEPTNHLDLAAIEWLEDYLTRFTGAVVLISHDRYLLDRLATRIAWVHHGRLDAFVGNYTAFIAQREIMELTQQRQYERQREQIEKTQEFIRRFSAGQRAREAKGREKRLTRFLASDALVQQVQDQKQIHLSFSTDQRAGDRVLSVRDLTKQYDARMLWDGINFDIVRGERIGIIGPNGSGKTTLLEALIGRRDADRGAIRWGANVSIGYYDQNLDDLDEESTPVQEVMAGRDCSEQEARDMLGQLLFTGEAADAPISVLSGGERARVRLAQLLMDKPNILVMDEPTNHLDIASCEALESTLRSFPGTILCVSHDRYFLNRIASRLLVLRPPAVVDFPGTYTAWQEKAQKEAAALAARETAAREAAQAAKAAAAAAQKPKTSNRKTNVYLRKFGRLTQEELEQQMAQTEQAIADCQAAFGDPEVFKDAEATRNLQADYDAKRAQLGELEEEYLLRLEA